MLTPAQLWARRIERWLEDVWVRVFLSLAIVASLLPLEGMGRFDPLFLLIFGTEFALRAAIRLVPRPEPHESLGTSEEFIEAETSVRRALGSATLLVVDLIALVSFFPFVEALGARWLRIFRLTRMLLLFGYWAPLVLDLWSILLRRERARQIVLMGVVVAGLSFAGAVFMHNFADTPVDVNDDGTIGTGDHDFVPLLWWSFRQVQDPGNMLSAPNVPGVMIVSLFLTVFGLFLVSFLIGLGTDVVHELLELTRLRPPGLQGHTVVVNVTPSTRRLLAELMRYYRKLLPTDAPVFSRGWFADLSRRGFGSRYLVVGTQFDPPEFLRQPELTRIVYRTKSDDEEELIRRADLLSAKRVLLLADETDSAPDAETIRSLVTLVERVRHCERRGAMIHPPGRQRVVIAEILDESNITAAQAALATAQDSFRGFVVPTEKLLALFVASVVRRKGLGDLLEELLTSRGHEIYTCFFRTPGLGFSMAQPPNLGKRADLALDRLLQQGLEHEEGLGGRVIPLGLLVEREAEPGGRDFDVWVNPRGEHAPESFRGFVGIADNFRSVRTLAERLPVEAPTRDENATGAPREVHLPELARTRRRKTTQVLVCGFRPGSIYMLEELFRADPGGKVLVLVESQTALQTALAALDTHSELVKHGLMFGRHGIFEHFENGVVLFRVDTDETGPASIMQLCVADWMASRHLVDLPMGFGHVGDLDAVVFVATDRESSDKRTTTTLLKLEQLFAGRDRHPRVVAEVIDGKLASGLEQRCHELGVDDVRVFSIQELRAYFLFQSVVVPGFDTVYSELLGSWGQSFVHKHVVGRHRGMCSFAGLALDLRRKGEILIALELGTDRARVQLCVAPSGYDRGVVFDLSELCGVWVIAPDVQPSAPPDGEIQTPTVQR